MFLLLFLLFLVCFGNYAFCQAPTIEGPLVLRSEMGYTLYKHLFFYGVYLMESRVAKWGNSLGVRIPRGIAKAVAIDENTTVNLVVENDYIVISKSKSYKLGELLSGIKPKNHHREINTGSPVGEEIW